jgi:hypothetical protein
LALGKKPAIFPGAAIVDQTFPPDLPSRMADPNTDAHEHLERARELVWDAIQRLEEAQRVLFKVGDCYVAQVNGDGVRQVIEVTENMADVAGDLTQCHIEIGKIGRIERRDRGWGPGAG